MCDEFEVSEYRDMLAIVRDRYGATTGPWTTDMFVEAVYTSLKQGRPKPSTRK